MEEHITKGFLYTLWGDKFTVKEGIIGPNRWRSTREVVFEYGKRGGDWTTCSTEPGQVVKAKFWLPERDDDLARRIMLNYHEECIEDLHKKIASHEAKIKILQDA